MTKELPCASLYTDLETDIEPILTNYTAPGVPIMLRSIITRLTRIVTALLLLQPMAVLAQGQDSSRWERDHIVISTMLNGIYSNGNQAYFDKRTKVTPAHLPHDLLIEGADNKSIFSATLTVSNESDTQPLTWVLVNDTDAKAVRMDISLATGEAVCPLYWSREAAQFRASLAPDCKQNTLAPEELVLSQQQLWWMIPGAQTGDLKLHRARQFSCYADVPGVGGGRDEPYNRFENIRIHDQGGEAWFTTEKGRTLGISLFSVDWPINNYTGFFTRDSLVIYVMEKDDSGRREHGYAFTLPEANRIGINLKWMLANCFMVSSNDDIPVM